MQIAYTGWTWLINHEDRYQWEFEQSLKESADLGYDSVENFAFITKYFEDDADKVKSLLDKYGLKLVNMYLHFTEEPEEDWENAVAYVDFMRRLGGVPYMNMQAPMWKDEPYDRPMDKKAIESFANLSNRVGQLCKENGVTACFHPHFSTAIYKEEEIDYYDSLVDHELVKLCLDTAHTFAAGMDAASAFDKYGDRIGYVHLKDVDPDVERYPYAIDRFRALGLGVIDFGGVLKSLKKHGFDGVLCVELDNPPVCNYRSAQISREYIHNVLGY